MAEKYQAMVNLGIANSRMKDFYLMINTGARGRNRTGMVLPPRDFKSLASTNFATRAMNAAVKEGRVQVSDRSVCLESRV